MRKSFVLLSTIVLLIITLVFGCVDDRTAALRHGRELAEKNCSGCHLFPSADLLPKQTWSEYVLPRMSRNFGLTHLGFNRYFESDSTRGTISIQDWTKILLYYLNESADSVIQDRATEFRVDSTLFTSAIVKSDRTIPATTFLKYFEDDKSILFADGIGKFLYKMNQHGVMQDSVAVGTGVSHVVKNGAGYSVLSMGVMYPSDERLGVLNAQQFRNSEESILLYSLQRPVHFQYADLNKDGRDDIIMCEFGNNTGSLSWFENTTDGNYRKHILRSAPGAVRVEVTDLNKDGLNDLVVLMAQGDEGIFAYINEGRSKFRETRLLQLPPSYGSNYFQLVDYNGDGYPDILTTNGDNGDYPPVLKPYHGIRLYLNTTQNEFRLSFFLPLNGASGARMFDMDKDGDLDIAAISYFPDFTKHAGESFVILKNDGRDEFEYLTIPEASVGRWLTMDAADIDEDGDIDVLLGCAPFSLGLVPPEVRSRWDKGSPAVLILKNNLIGKQAHAASKRVK